MKKIKINYIEDLEILRNLTNDTYYISLERNIDFEDKNSYKKEENYHKYLYEKTKNGFNPIDIKDKTFIFNGNNNVISNLSIIRPKENNVGFFKHINNNSIIKNLNIINSYVEGKYKVGSFAGSLDGQINNCILNGIVKGKMIIGGFVGESNNECSFYNDLVQGEISGNSFIGGILGKGESSTFINNEVEGKILFKNIDNNTIGEFVGCSIYTIIKEKEYRKRPFISYDTIGGLILK